MYHGYFGLAEAPFSIAPDPRYLYMSRGHQEALAHLLYGLGGEGGFVLLTGEVGTGKTTLCRCLLEQIPDTCDVAYIFNPRLTVPELLSTLCNEFGIACPEGNASVKVFVDCINAHLLDAHARGRNTVLIIDEAQNLSADVLEQMRLLTNLETSRRKLLQIILLGQPELSELLARAELRQLAQRIVARYHLGALPKNEVAAYIHHRLGVSGAREDLIPSGLVARLHRLSGGVPRVLNLLCDRALLGAYAQGKRKVDRATLDQAAREVFGRPARPARRTAQAVAVALTFAAGAAIAYALYHQRGETTPAAPAAVASAEHPAADEAIAQPAASVLEWPLQEPLERSRAVAYGALFGAWGMKDVPAACAADGASPLRCRTARGGLAELRRLDRPAILEMRDGAGRGFYACLTALDADSASFTFGSEVRRVALDALALQWSGLYTAAWRMPPEVAPVIKPGERGTSVLWLRERLARLDGSDRSDAQNPVYDAALLREVKQFQLAQGLVPDGTAGAQTLMHLAAATDEAAPRLGGTPGER